MNTVEEYISTYIELISLHIAPSKYEPSFLRGVLKYLDGLKPTPRRLGAFSFAASNLELADMYCGKGNSNHFILHNRAYAATYYAFGGSPRARAYGLHLGPELRTIITSGSTKITPQVFGVNLLRQYGLSAPYYNVPVPMGADFDIPEMMGFHPAYVSAGLGVRMSQDTLGAVTAERLSDIINYVESIYSVVPTFGTTLKIFDDFIQTSCMASCDLELLQHVIELTNNTNFGTLVNDFGNYFRLFMISDTMFTQVMALPDQVLTEEIRRLYVRQLLQNPDAVVDRAVATNIKIIKQKTIDYGCTQILYDHAYTEAEMLRMSPGDLSYSHFENSLYITSINYEENSSIVTARELDAQNNLRFYPTDEVSILIKAVSKPQLSLFNCDESYVALWTPDDDIFLTLNEMY